MNRPVPRAVLSIPDQAEAQNKEFIVVPVEIIFLHLYHFPFKRNRYAVNL